MKEKKGRMIKIVVAVAIVVLFVWFFIIYPWGYFNKNENKLKEAAKHYFEINYRELPENNEIKTLSLSELSKQKYIDDLFVPYTKNVCSVNDSWVKVRKEGDSYKYYTYLKCGYLSSSVDHTGPEITLNGESEIILDKGEAYNEAGIKRVYDKVDKELKIEDVQIKNDTVDTSKLGTYKVTYTAYDSLDNETVVERTVKVVQKLGGVINNDTSKRGYYTGQASTNYIRFSGMLFRIVGMNNDGSVRIVSAEDIANVNYDSIQTWLDNYYYSHLTDKAKKFLVESTFCDDRLQSTNLVSTECSTKGSSKKVGILSAEDYSKSLEGSVSYLYTDTIVWLANDKNDKEAWTSRSWYAGVDASVKYMEFNKDYSFGIRPVLTIKKDTLIKGGNGTFEDPYILGDLESAKAGDKLNTRITGEWVTYGGYDFRIVETASDGTIKVISNNVLQISNAKPEISYQTSGDVKIYNPKEKGNIAYIIENETPNYIKTGIFTKHEIEVPIYKTHASYGKMDSSKKYKVKFAAPSLHEMFSASNMNLTTSYWLRDSSKEANRKYLTANAGVVYYDKQHDNATAGIRIVAYIKKDTTILDGKGTQSSPYTLVK